MSGEEEEGGGALICGFVQAWLGWAGGYKNVSLGCRGERGGWSPPNHLLVPLSCECTHCCVFACVCTVHSAQTAAAALSCSAFRTRHPLREAALGLQHVVGAAVPGEPVPVPGERQCVQLAAIQSLQQRQHALLQQDQVRWAEPSN